MLFQTLTETITQILRERGDPVPNLVPSTALDQCGLDSLDIAALVARMQEKSGIDPFADDSFGDFPRDLNQLAMLYEKYERKRSAAKDVFES